VEKNPPFLRPSASPWSALKADHLIHSELTDRIIACAIAVHRALGPGFLEKVYEEAFVVELRRRRIPYLRQHAVTITYEGVTVGDHRIDLIIDGKVGVELKAIKELDDIHLAVVLSYLKATGLHLGLIINFDGAKTRVRRVLRGFKTDHGEAEGRRNGDED